MESHLFESDKLHSAVFATLSPGFSPAFVKSLLRFWTPGVLSRLFITLILVYVSLGSVSAQISLHASTDRGQRLTIPISCVSRPPTLEDFRDMKPNPELAREMTKLEDFIQWIPSDGQPATQRTEAFIGYDCEHLYAVFLCFDETPEKIRARLSRREDIHRDDWVEYSWTHLTISAEPTCFR